MAAAEAEAPVEALLRKDAELVGGGGTAAATAEEEIDVRSDSSNALELLSSVLTNILPATPARGSNGTTRTENNTEDSSHGMDDAASPERTSLWPESESSGILETTDDGTSAESTPGRKDADGSYMPTTPSRKERNSNNIMETSQNSAFTATKPTGTPRSSPPRSDKGSPHRPPIFPSYGETDETVHSLIQAISSEQLSPKQKDPPIRHASPRGSRVERLKVATTRTHRVPSPPPSASVSNMNSIEPDDSSAFSGGEMGNSRLDTCESSKGNFENNTSGSFESSMSVEDNSGDNKLTRFEKTKSSKEGMPTSPPEPKAVAKSWEEIHSTLGFALSNSSLAASPTEVQAKSMETQPGIDSSQESSLRPAVDVPDLESEPNHATREIQSMPSPIGTASATAAESPDERGDLPAESKLAAEPAMMQPIESPQPVQPPQPGGHADETPLMSNHARKKNLQMTSPTIPEEVSERSDFGSGVSLKFDVNWQSAASAVNQVTGAMNKIRAFGESFLYDPKPSKRFVDDKPPDVLELSNDSGSKQEQDDPEELDIDPEQKQNLIDLVREIRSPAMSRDGYEEKKIDPEDTRECSDGSPDSDRSEKDPYGQHKPTQRGRDSPTTRTRRPPDPPQLTSACPEQLAKPVPMQMSRTVDAILQPDMDDPPEELPKNRKREPSAEIAAQISPPSAAVAASDAPKASSDVASQSVATGAMTPMMRMRVPQAQESVLMGQAEQEAELKKNETRVDIKRQKNWKENKKDADRKREKKSRKAKSSTSKKGKKNRRRAASEDASASAKMNCQIGLQQIFQTFIEGQCMNFDEVSDSEVGSSMGGSDEELSFQESEDEITRNSARTKKSVPIDEEKSAKRVERRQKESPRHHATSGVDTPKQAKSVVATRGDAATCSKANIKDKKFIHEFIAGLSSTGVKVLLHKPSKKNTISQPKDITVFLKLGIEANMGRYCEPALQLIADDGVEAMSIKLFDIRSFEKASALQLQSYPLAMPGRSLFVRMSPGEYVFEAESEEEAVRFVHGMRWLIARLSFNLIIGNTSVSCELLDIDTRRSRLSETNLVRAMNDVTNHLIDKSTVI